MKWITHLFIFFTNRKVAGNFSKKIGLVAATNPKLLDKDNGGEKVKTFRLSGDLSKRMHLLLKIMFSLKATHSFPIRIVESNQFHSFFKEKIEGKKVTGVP